MHATSWLALSSFAAVLLVATRRSRLYGVFTFILLGSATWATVVLGSAAGEARWLLLAFQLAASVHLLGLALRPATRGTAYRFLISIPGLWFVASSMLAWPWALVASFGVDPFGWWAPFALGLLGLAQSLWTREEVVDVALDGRDAGPLARHAASIPAGGPPPLTLVQITDPHLGPFMSLARLRKICQRAVERTPDLVVLTGDLMTLESHDVELVSAALEPLRAMQGRVFACHGNHDHEARAVVTEAYHRIGARLLVDEAAVVETAIGPVQVIGADFAWQDRSGRLAALAEGHPRLSGVPRLWLLHDPGAFRHIPDGEADLALSGHTHGGQIGTLSLGGRSTFVSWFTSVPDHGLWAQGHNRLYVHRAQGHYGFPIRLGVPAEQSLLRVHRAP